MSLIARGIFMNRSAILSLCGRYRYWLVRQWEASKPMLVTVMLNPSTGDHERDDPTILALVHFATLWGYGGLIIVNLNAFQASQPPVMHAEHLAGRDVEGPENNQHLTNALSYAKMMGGPVLVAWGNGGSFRDAHLKFATNAAFAKVPLACLGTTQSGAPKHPMARGKHRIPRDQQPLPWSWVA